MSFLRNIVIFTVLCIALVSNALADDLDISAHSAILCCADTGDVLYEKNADEKMLIASTTKLMTALVVLENSSPDEEVVPKAEWCDIEGSSMYLDYTKSYTVKELLTGLLLVSGNDAATTLANHISGSEEEFAKLMNEKAAQLGMNDSHFENPHGLDAKEHYSTARDMAILAEHCLKNDELMAIASQVSADVAGLTYYNHNRLLREYEGCNGLKTGYTIAAGRTLVSSAQRNGMSLVCVTLSAPNDWEDHKKLLDYGYEKYNLSTYDKNSFSLDLTVISAAKESVRAVPENRIAVLTSKTDSVDVKIDVPRILFAGGIKGEKVGELRVFVNGELAASENLIYTENVIIDKNMHLSVWEQIQRAFGLGSRPLYVEEGQL